MKTRIHFKSIFLIALTLCCQITAFGFAQEKISFPAKSSTIIKVLKEVESQTTYRFVFSTEIKDIYKAVNFGADEAELPEVMVDLLKNTDLAYSLKDNNLVVIYSSILPINTAAINQTTIEGKVVDEKGNTLPGVTVRNTVNKSFAQTDAKGKYRILGSSEGSLEFSFIGFNSQTVSINGRTEINVVLVEDSRQLEEVTVTGYTQYAKELSASATTTVNSQVIADVPVASLDQILQGRVPGMSVLASSGQPGTSASVVIRGVGSISGSSTPLYIMDGIPIEGNYFQTINPNDVENITVLRDASAKSLYGSRGSNGVVVITTKKGKSGKFSVDYTSQYGFSNLTEPKFRMMNSEQRLRFEEELGLEIDEDNGPGWAYSSKNPDNAGWSDQEKRHAEHILDSLRNLNVDWRDFFFQKGKFMEQQVSISGGNENVRFFNSLNYYKQDGVAVRSNLERFSLRSNVDFNSNRFTGSVNLSIGYSNSSFTGGEGVSGVGTSMASVYYALPYEYPYAPDGTLIHFGNEDDYDILDQREGSAGLERLLNSSDKTDQLKSIIGVSLGYQITPQLKASTRIGLDYRNSMDQTFINPDSYYGSKEDYGKGHFGEGTRRNFNFISTTGLTFANKFADKHDVEVSGFFEYVYDNYRAFDYIGYGIDGRLPETPAGITVSETFLPELGGGRQHSALVSYMGIARYSYDNKYTLSGSYRYDGSTQVSPKNRWHGFYSIGGNWNAKAEGFLIDNSLITTLNFRASYGITASPFSGSFNYLPTYSISTSYGGRPAIRPASAGNADYDWEYVDEFNTGFDLSLFKARRLRISVDYYNRITRNMFIDQPLSATSGFDELSLSSGKMRNRGVEFDIKGDVISTPDFGFTLGLNAGYNKNKILFLTDLVDELMDGDSRIIRVGLPYGSYLAPGWAGVRPADGVPEYYNRDGSKTEVYDEEAQTVATWGSTYPVFTGGMSTGLRWKSFTADALFSFVSKVSRWNNEDRYNENPSYVSSNQSIRMLEDRWKKPGDHAILQRIDIPREYTSKDIQDASFIRLRNLTFGYSIPTEILQRSGFVKGVKVFIQGQNLITWTKWRGLDPESSSHIGRYNYPAARTYTAGLNVNF